jgi:DNA-binding HxlR family transcriptional regulator
MVEDVIRCKWSLTVIDLVHRGINRPGAMVHAVEGLTTKVPNERLDKLQRYGILERTVFPEKPPRVEYRFTAFGRKFFRIIDAIDELQADIVAEFTPGRDPS